MGQILPKRRLLSKKLDRLISFLKKGVVLKASIASLLPSVGLFGNQDTELQILVANGVPISIDDDEIRLKTLTTPIAEQVFCVTDIETSGSKPHNSQIIEIGAVKIKNLEIIDRFESYVNCSAVPEYISKITGIHTSDTVNAPELSRVLERYKLFLGDSVFVAHNVNFDYNFISTAMRQCNLGELMNRKLCTINLARRTIESERYALSHLNTHLNINHEPLHRAYSDALVATKVLLESLKNLPPHVKSAEELIDYSQSKIEPKIKEEKTKND